MDAENVKFSVCLLVGPQEGHPAHEASHQNHLLGSTRLQLTNPGLPRK